MDKKKILIVDDESDFTELAKFVLEKTDNYQIYIEQKSSNALSTAREIQPDLILLDVMMPKLSGAEAADLLKKDPATKDIPIVFLTAIATKDEAAKNYGFIGGYPFISKGITFDELISSINKYL